MSTSDIGTLLAIATGLPATANEAGYEALTWVNVAGLQSVGQIGDAHAVINVPDLATGRSEKLKGEVTGAAVPVVLREVAADAGQAAVLAACASTSGSYSWRISEPGTAEQYISGPAHSWLRNERSVTSYAGFTFTIEQNTAAVSGT